MHRLMNLILLHIRDKKQITIKNIVMLVIFFYSLNLQANSLLEQAIQLKKEGKPYASLELLQKVESVSPARIYLEQAENYLLIENYNKARKLFLKVLKNKKIPNNVRKNTLKFLKVLEQEERRSKKIKHQFFGTLSLSYGYNNNPTFASEQNCPDDTVFPKNIRKIIICNYKKNDHYRKLKIKYQYLFRFDHGFNVAGRPVFVNLKNTFNFNQNKFLTITRETYRFIQLKSQLNFVQLNNWHLGIEYSHDEILRYEDDYASYNGLKIELTKIMGGFKIKPFIKQTRRHYLAFRSEKTGWRSQFGLKIDFSIKQKFASELAISHTKQHAQNNAFAYDLNRISLRNTFRLTKQSYFYANLYHNSYHYKGNEQVFINEQSQEVYQDPLEQKRLKIKVGARYFITQHLFSELKFNYIRSKANHLLRQYKQQTVELAIGFKF